MTTTYSRRSFAVLLASLTTTLVLCASAPSHAQQDISKVTLRIGDQTGLMRAKLEAAGLLEGVPYTIEWSVYPAAVNLHEALKAGAVDIGYAADSPTVSAIAGGSKIKVVAAYGNGGKGTSVLVPEDSDIKTIADLKGKTISPTTRGSVAHYLTLGVLKKAGIDQKDVKLAFLSPTDASAAFQAGSIDAWTTWGVFTARTVGVLRAKVLIDGEGINTGHGVISATDEALRDPGKVAAIADYADRYARGHQWSKDNKQAYIDFFSAFSRQDKTLIETVYPEEAAYRRLPLDNVLAASLQNVFETWKEAGVLSGDLKLVDFVYRDLPTEQLQN
ncbi:ABC transporter substrate-binding protein [Limoniibacter endophyticus]|uniref:Putative aliphatic sulfonates-binding protein n=1 Tax=Limoniibacter endophyticus TaxID=1565040 RepID=A0A8J3DN08_9HYPH|nr:ABC transporter substrate-binding protein [Limoniibacter endophyticus]GHC72739.1 hypothetical protein GCM10010136_20660 [Limoniibacter endophyticus]